MREPGGPLSHRVRGTIVLVATACSGRATSPSTSATAAPALSSDSEAALPSPMRRKLLEQSKDPDSAKPGATRQALRDYIDRELPSSGRSHSRQSQVSHAAASMRHFIDLS